MGNYSLITQVGRMMGTADELQQSSLPLCQPYCFDLSFSKKCWLCMLQMFCSKCKLSIRHNYKWILLAFLVSSPSPSPGASEHCLLSSAILNKLTWAWSAVWLMLGWKLKFTSYEEKAIEGRKVYKPRTKGAENEILFVILPHEPLTHPHIPFSRKQGENWTLSLLMCIYNTRNS